MDLFDLFALSHKKGEAMEFSDFQKIGWDKGEYIFYLRFCEQIRASLIMGNMIRSRHRHPVSPNFERKSRIKSISYDELINHLIEMPVLQLLTWLQEYTEKSIPQPRIGILLLSSFITYGRFKLMYDTLLDPSFVYISLFDLMPIIEEFIYMTLFDIEIPFEIEPEPDELTTDEIIKKVRLARLREEYTKEPDPPSDVGNYNQVIIWARKQGAYQEVQDDIMYIDALEDELRKRGIPDKVKIHPEPIEIPTFDQTKSILYVYGGGTIICRKDNHDVFDVNCEIETLEEHAVISAQYCATCKRFTISEMSYYSFLKKYKFLPVIIRFVDSKGRPYPDGIKQDKSPLMLAGYSVSQKAGLDETTRHRLLAFLIDKNIIKKYKIIDYLEYYISYNMNNPSQGLAISKWENDLNFVLRYNMDNQSNHHIDAVKKY